MELSTSQQVKTKAKTKEKAILPEPTTREREWFTASLERGRRERFIVMKRKVTPGLASAMLNVNPMNRPVVETQVRLHEERLRRGDFVLTHQGISFAKAGVLNDGQHRLIAIARSGVSGDLQITFGAEREEFKVIDTGRIRAANDIIGITEKDWPTLRAALARIIAIAETNELRIDPQIVADRAIAMRDDEATKRAMALASVVRNKMNPTPVAAAYWWIATHSPTRLRVEEFFDGIASGEGLSGVKLRLREWLIMRNINAAKQYASKGFWRTGGIILAWNAWLKGHQRVILSWNKANELPEPK